MNKKNQRKKRKKTHLPREADKMEIEERGVNRRDRSASEKINHNKVKSFAQYIFKKKKNQNNVLNQKFTQQDR